MVKKTALKKPGFLTGQEENEEIEEVLVQRRQGELKDM
jgi:hypothetical protein